MLVYIELTLRRSQLHRAYCTDESRTPSIYLFLTPRTIYHACAAQHSTDAISLFAYPANNYTVAYLHIMVLHITRLSLSAVAGWLLDMQLIIL